MSKNTLSMEEIKEAIGDWGKALKECSQLSGKSPYELTHDALIGFGFDFRTERGEVFYFLECDKESQFDQNAALLLMLSHVVVETKGGDVNLMELET